MHLLDCELTVTEIITAVNVPQGTGKRVHKDRLSYDFAYLSGGERLMQPDFCAALLRAPKQKGVHTAVDSCRFVSRRTMEKTIPYAHIFLYDLKAIDEHVHIRCTGQSNRLILEKLQYLDSLGCATGI